MLAPVFCLPSPSACAPHANIPIAPPVHSALQPVQEGTSPANGSAPAHLLPAVLVAWQVNTLWCTDASASDREIPITDFLKAGYKRYRSTFITLQTCSCYKQPL